MNKQSQLDTISGGRSITINFEPVAGAVGTGMRTPDPETVLVRQIPVKEYQAGFLVADNQHMLAAFFVKKNPEWINGGTPKSFAEIKAVGREVNGYFFDSLAEERKLGADRLAAFVQIQQSNPEMADKILAAGAKAQQSALQNTASI